MRAFMAEVIRNKAIDPAKFKSGGRISQACASRCDSLLCAAYSPNRCAECVELEKSLTGLGRIPAPKPLVSMQNIWSRVLLVLVA